MMAARPSQNPMLAGYPATESAHIYTHSRTRTTSSNIFPTHANLPLQQAYPSSMQAHSYTSRRTPSSATFSTTASSGNSPIPNRPASQDLRRSTSSRSSGLSQPTGYVALMRRQKATVWCDRAQHEDPRLLAQQKAAKIRAAMEVIGGRGTQRIPTSGSGSLAGSNRVTAKIRHHGKSGLVGYSPGDLVGGVGGVPMRLSASEVEGGDSDDDADSGHVIYNRNHHRSGSGRSSIGSAGRRGLTYSRQSGASSTIGRWSAGNTPPSERQNSMDNLAEETPIALSHKAVDNYFAADGGGDGTRSAGSGSSAERADILPDINTSDAARLASNSLLKSTVTREKSMKSTEELRRRGSVDERTMTLSAGRLYIANPDADSD